jgi:hypothetical protein
MQVHVVGVQQHMTAAMANPAGQQLGLLTLCAKCNHHSAWKPAEHWTSMMHHIAPGIGRGEKYVYSWLSAAAQHTLASLTQLQSAPNVQLAGDAYGRVHVYLPICNAAAHLSA